MLRKFLALPLIRRAAHMAIALLGLSILIFIIARVLPGDPVLAALGPNAPEWVRERMRAAMHLNDPVYVQYYYWLRDALSGKLGQSLVTSRNVEVDIIAFLPATIELAAFTAIITVVFAISLGVIAGRHANTWIDNVVRGIAYIGVSIPSFVIAIILLLVFGYHLNIMPSQGRLSLSLIMPPHVTGLITIDALLAGKFDVFVDALWHLIMPALSLAAGTIAQEARITRANIVENSRKDYILSATSHGVPERLIVFKYLLKPSLIPTVSMTALDIASIIGGSFIVETIFNWPGFSKYGTTVILRKDLNAIVGVVMVIGAVFVVTNLIVDIIIGYLDPRIRMMKAAE
jgi:peptide/nickel transport system permease protein